MRVSGYQRLIGWTPLDQSKYNRGCITAQKLFEQIVDTIQGLWRTM